MSGTVPAREDVLDLDRAGVKHWDEELDGHISAVAGDLGGVVDEVPGNVGVLGFQDFLLEVEKIAELLDGLELFPLASVGLGGVYRAYE